MLAGQAGDQKVPVSNLALCTVR